MKLGCSRCFMGVRTEIAVAFMRSFLSHTGKFRVLLVILFIRSLKIKVGIPEPFVTGTG